MTKDELRREALAVVAEYQRRNKMASGLALAAMEVLRGKCLPAGAARNLRGKVVQIRIARRGPLPDPSRLPRGVSRACQGINKSRVEEESE